MISKIFLRFLSDCFQYVAAERPSTTFVLRGLTQILAEVVERYRDDCHLKQARDRFQDKPRWSCPWLWRYNEDGPANYFNDYGYSQDNNQGDNDAPGETRQKVKLCRKHQFHFPRQESGLGCS